MWPFFIFQDLAILKLIRAKFGLFNFFEPGNPDLKEILPKQRLFIEAICFHKVIVPGLGVIKVENFKAEKHFEHKG
jgi:hypothetical protein